MCRIGWLNENIRCLVILYKWNGVKCQIATRWMINKATRRMINKATRRMINKTTRRMSSMYPTDDKIQISVDSDNTVTCIECLQKESGNLFNRVLRTNKHYHFHASYEDFQRCWNRVMKQHGVRLDRFYFITLSYYHVNLVIYKPSVASGTN